MLTKSTLVTSNKKKAGFPPISNLGIIAMARHSYDYPQATLGELKQKFIDKFKSSNKQDVVSGINLIALCGDGEKAIIPKYEEIVTEDNFATLFSYPALIPNRNLSDDRALDYVNQVNFAMMMQNFWDNIDVNDRVLRDDL